MSNELIEKLIKSFLACSKSAVDTLAKAVSTRRDDAEGRIALYSFGGTDRREVTYDRSCFFLRTSMEYSSPQLTIEELQGLLAARLLEVCVNCRLKDPLFLHIENIGEVREALQRPPEGRIVPFILETDDVEPDRYSNNPLRSSIVESGQSAFPVANVSTEALKLDDNFVKKYKGSLISEDETDLVTQHLKRSHRYVDFVDGVKNEELSRVYRELGLELRLPQLRMPLETLMEEAKGGRLHSLIQASHRDYQTIETIYSLMGRSMKKKTLLPTVPHSPRGFGSKRAARGRLTFLNGTLATARVRFETTSLYPNMADPNDLSFAKCQDEFEVAAGNLTNYSYLETPSSPQFALYALFSPEDSSLWHGVGEYAGNEILRSYASIQAGFLKKQIFQDLKEPGLRQEAPIMFNLDPGRMWVHPVYHNIDAGVGCVKDLASLLSQEMKISTIAAKLREPMME